MNITCPNCGATPVKDLGMEVKAPKESGDVMRKVHHVKCTKCGNTGTVDGDGASWSKNAASKAAGANASAAPAPASVTSVAAPMNTKSRYIPTGTQ